METKLKLIIAAAAILVLSSAAVSIVSNARVRSLEREIGSATAKAIEMEKAATAAELAAAGYKRKIEFLESEIAAIGDIARRQDEELEKMGSDVGSARIDLERERLKRTVGRTADELCERLAELGHPCD